MTIMKQAVFARRRAVMGKVDMKKTGIRYLLVAAGMAAAVLSACGQPDRAVEPSSAEELMREDAVGASPSIEPSGDEKDVPVDVERVEESDVSTKMQQTASAGDVAIPDGNGFLIVIDPGHQARGDSETEPIGPGATERKARVAGGTRGCVSGLYEYELTLAVSEKLAEELEARGYQTLMTRVTNDVNISNAERAEIANKAGADAFVRIHANGAANSSANGAETLCQTASNPYNGNLYESSRCLAEKALDGLTAATGARKRGVVETDAMSGVNWCQVPATIVEMGFMTNEAEDALMATEEYQRKLATGIADGLDAYFAEISAAAE